MHIQKNAFVRLTGEAGSRICFLREALCIPKKFFWDMRGIGYHKAVDFERDLCDTAGITNVITSRP